MIFIANYVRRQKEDTCECTGTCTYTTLTDFNTKYLVMCKVYTDVGGIK